MDYGNGIADERATSGSAVPSTENAKTYWDTIACQYLEKTNVWWYTLRDVDASIEEKYTPPIQFCQKRRLPMSLLIGLLFRKI